MEKIAILLMASIIEEAQLEGFTDEELSDFWSDLSLCRDDENFSEIFDDNEQRTIKNAIKNLEKELKRRGKQPVNFFQLMQENPLQVELYLKQFTVMELLNMDNDLSECDNNETVHDFRRLIQKQLCSRVAMA